MVEFACQQTGHENAMCLEQVVFLLRLPVFEAVISGNGVVFLLDFPLCTCEMQDSKTKFSIF